MITIEIYENVENINDMVELLRAIAHQVEKGYTSGVSPNWELFEEDDNEQE
jgi:hypothetical protein